MDGVAAPRAPIAGVRIGLRVSPVAVAAILTFAALGVRLIGITMRPLWLDEAYSAWFSAQSWHDLWTVVPTYETHPPFYYSLLKLWRVLFGGSALALRLPSALLGAATVPVIILAARELERLRPSGRPLLAIALAGFLAAFGPTLIEHGQEARPYAPMAFTYAVAMLGLLRLLRDFETGDAGSVRSWAIFAVGAELTLWSHALGIIYAACLALALLPSWLTAKQYRRGIIAAAAVLLLYLPCLWLMAARTRDWGTGWLTWSPEMLLTLLSVYGVPVEVLTIWSAVAALILFLCIKRAVAAAFAGQGWSADRALLILWWGPPLVTALVSAVYMPLFLPRTLTATIIPCYLAIGAALARVPSSKERLALSVALAVALVPSSVAMALRPATEPWDQVDSYLQRNVRPGDVVWLYPTDSALPLRDAGPYSTYERRGVPADYPALDAAGPRRAGSPAVPSMTPQAMQQLAHSSEAKRAGTIWLVTCQAQYFDPDADFVRALSQDRRPGQRQRWGYLAVQPFVRR